MGREGKGWDVVRRCESRGEGGVMVLCQRRGAKGPARVSRCLGVVGKLSFCPGLVGQVRAVVCLGDANGEMGGSDGFGVQ